MLSHDGSFSAIAHPLSALNSDSSSSVLTPSSAPLAPSLSLSSRPSAVAFVDGGLADYQTLVDGVSTGTAVYVLDPNGDALVQISQVLAGYSNLDSVAIFSHGSNGALQLGNTSLSADTLVDYAGVLQSWVGAFSEAGDLLLFGCEVAEGAAGQGFVSQIAALTGADVSASTDLTGSSALGGDWEMEFSTGNIEASDFLSPWAQAAYQNVLATFTVTNTANSGAGSLRDAVAQSNTTAGVDTINFATSGTITLFDSLQLTDSAMTTIDATGRSITLTGLFESAFQISSGAVATFTGLTISGSSDFAFGGGIYNEGTLTVSNSTFSRNSVGGSGLGFGGGIYNEGTLSVSNSTFSGNSAGESDDDLSLGGAIYNEGTLSVSNSTFSGNSVAGGIAGGGGIYSRGTLSVSNSTFSGNSAPGFGFGGAIELGIGTLTLSNSTLSGNSAGFGGGGIYIQPGTLTIISSIVAGNTAPQGREIYNFNGTASSGGNNLFGESSETTGAALIGVTTTTTDILATSDGTKPTALNAILAPLASNGGRTQTQALVAGSPAIDTGSNPNNLATDQRGTGFDRVVGSAADIGAFEFVLNRPPVATNDNFTINEDTVLTGNVITNPTPNGADSDPDGNLLTVATVNGTAISGATTIALGKGSLTINRNGNFTYTPTANANGSDSFTYTLSDGTVGSNTATVSLTIAPVNDAPALTGTKATLANGTEDTAYVITTADLLTGYTDVEGDTLSVFGLTATNGTLTNNNGTYTFTPNANYNGTVNLGYTVIDGQGGSVDATQSFVLDAVNDAPTITAPTSVNVLSGGTISGISIADVDAGTGIITTTLSVANGSLNLSALNGATATGLNTGTVTLNGTVAQINAALTSLRYIGGTFSGNTNLTVTVNDNGNAGSGGFKTDTQAIALSIAQNLGTLGNPAINVRGTVNSTDPIDRYQFTLSSRTTSFRLTLGDLSSNADVFILNSNGAVVASSTNTGTRADVINHLPLDAGTYFIEVRGISGSTGYNLSFRR